MASAGRWKRGSSSKTWSEIPRDRLMAYAGKYPGCEFLFGGGRQRRSAAHSSAPNDSSSPQRTIASPRATSSAAATTKRMAMMNRRGTSRVRCLRRHRSADCTSLGRVRVRAKATATPQRRPLACLLASGDWSSGRGGPRVAGRRRPDRRWRPGLRSHLRVSA